MSFPDWLRKALQERADRETAALDEALSEIVWMPPEETVIRRPEVPPGVAYVLPGHLFPDGKDRTVINPKQELRERPDDGKEQV